MSDQSNENRISVRDFDVSLMNFLNKEYEKLTAEERKIYCEDLPDFDTSNITLRTLCAALGIAVPAKFEAIADDVQKLALRSNRVKPDDVYLVLRSAKDFYTSELANQYQEAIERGAKLVIMGRDEFEGLGLNEAEHPVILTDNHNKRIFRLYSIIRRQHKSKVVMLTGSVGKTTTKDLCYTVAKSEFKTYANANNTNTPHQIALHLLYDRDDSNDVFIHEAGAGYFGSVRLSASMLQPDILVLTNVYNHHLQVFKTYEKLFAEKVSGDDYLSEDGVIITNFDDENIRKHTFKHKVKSFSINYPDADYRALNIKQHQEKLSFDVYEKETGKTIHLSVNILGEHNVYNILTAFVLGKALGMSDEAAIDALLEYRATGVRQNLAHIGGVHLLLDCYNVAEESIIAMLSAGENFELDGKGRRIALIGGENKLGANVKSRSYAFGAELAKLNIDRYLFCCTKDRSTKALNHFGDAQSIRDGFKEVSDIPCRLATNIEEMTTFLKERVKRNDLVMVKGIYYLQMPIAVDKAFGTSFSFDLSHNKASMKTIRDGDYTAKLIPDFGELELFAAPVVDGVVEIPNAIKDYPVFRIHSGCFRDQEEITTVNLSESVQNIGEEAFAGCTKLDTLTVPGNVKVVESRAFNGCTELTRVALKPGVTHIGYKAFADCKNLERVRIPGSVGMIEDKAFSNCPKVKIVCRENTFAHKYAIANNIPVKLVVPTQK